MLTTESRPQPLEIGRSDVETALVEYAKDQLSASQVIGTRCGTRTDCRKRTESDDQRFIPPDYLSLIGTQPILCSSKKLRPISPLPV
jgi:hypothetical protein